MDDVFSGNYSHLRHERRDALLPLIPPVRLIPAGRFRSSSVTRCGIRPLGADLNPPFGPTEAGREEFPPPVLANRDLKKLVMLFPENVAQGRRTTVHYWPVHRRWCI